MEASEPASSAPAPRRDSAAGIVLALLAGLPFLVASAPQLTDYPSHLARYHVMLDDGRSAWLAQYYDFAWIINGNLGADLLMWPLGKLLGVETAGWLIGLLIAVLSGLAVIAVEWTLRRRIGVGSMLALAAVWSPAMAMGFYNFCLSLALALLAFALWVRLEGRRWRPFVFLPVALIVWLCHVSGWGVLGILVFGYEWHRRKGLPAFLAPWPLLLPVIPQLLAPAARGSLNFGDHVVRYKSVIWLQALRGESLRLDIAALLVIVAVIALALWKRRIDGRLGWAALILAVLTIVMPRHFGGGDFADYRLIAVALMTGSLAIDWPQARWLMWAAAALFLVRLGDTALAWHEHSRKTDRILTMLDHLPQGARVAAAVQVERAGWALNPLEHVTSYATVRRDALVNSHFAVPGVHMLQLREGGPGFADPSHRVFHSPGEAIDLSGFAPARQADYLWWVGDAEPARLPPGSAVIARAPGTLLARLANSQGSR